MSKVIVSWSGGKDSCLAGYKAMSLGYEVSHLINTISHEYKRVRFHGTKNTLLQKQAQAIGIPLLQRETTADGYEHEFKETIRSVIPNGIEGIVFGDIYLHMREWADKVCGELGIQAIEPLCGHNAEEILLDFIDSGFEAVVVATQANLLGEEWLGRRLNSVFLEDIKRKQTIDACGENGEYHTFVIDGPLFRQRIEICESQKVLRDGYWFLDICEHQILQKVALPASLP